ncbi:unnamed protein product [Rotaria magnacalcarata]|uniref:Uncharacterized protein n=1 Tax=Rotaria magnacalcarata TaxID=392030 RepID=A0A815BR94_9BILA|nr:unnamed protein product [Rotaria magnacalcarata]
MGQSSSMSSDSSASSMQDLDTNMSSSSTSSSYIPYTAGRTTAAIVPSSTFPGVDVVTFHYYFNVLHLHPLLSNNSIRMNNENLQHLTERREFVRDMKLFQKLLRIAKVNVSEAMEQLFLQLPNEYLKRAGEYYTIFLDIHHQTQRDAYVSGQLRDEFTWPTSFPDCTPALRQFVDRWIQEELPRQSQAKCLILIGPASTGKTSFAKSIPGLNNYFSDVWSSDHFNPYARYTIYENVSWNNFERRGYPDKSYFLLRVV